METLIKTKQKRNDPRAKYAEHDYVERNLQFYINKNKKTTRTNIGDFWVIQEDRDTLLREQLLKYTLDHFNVYELYLVFFNPTPNSFTYSYVDRARSEAIDNINKDNSFTPEEAKLLKRKVWDMHPIFFGLIVEFVCISELFWDREKEVIVYPNYKIISK